VLTSPTVGSVSNLRLGTITRGANSSLNFVARGRDLSTNEIQTLTVPATVTTFNVSFNGSAPSGSLTRATLTAAQLQAALEALPTVGGGNVAVTGGTAGPYTISFLNRLAATNVVPIVATLVTGAGAPVVATTAEGNPTGATVILTTVPAAAGATVGTAGNEILPYATVRSVSGQVDFATQIGAGSSVQAFTNYSTGAIDAAAVGSNYLLTADQTLTANRSFNAVLLRGDNLDLGGNAGVNLTLSGGGLVSAGAGNTVTVPTVTLGVEGIVHVAPTALGAPGATLDIQSAVAGGFALTKGGTGTLTISGTTANTYTGAVVVTEGVLSAQKNTAFGTAAGGVVVSYGGTLELISGLTVGTPGAGADEALTLNGSGEGVTGNVPLRVTGGGTTT
jgi:autotransporter-associated beta strand protein